MERINFSHVSKMYLIERERKLKHALFNPFARTNQRKFIALSDLNFSINDKETVGLIGPNGSGKTTILRLIAKITYPTSGSIFVNGRMAPLIELGAGFHPEFSGRENIFLNGVILGMTLKEVSGKFDSILAFAGGAVREFIDTPIKKYSLGMRARLGFSIAVHCDPEILLIDESLSVGDEEFYKKCLQKLNDFKRQGKTIVLASHVLSFIKSFCSRVIKLDQGHIVQDRKI